MTSIIWADAEREWHALREEAKTMTAECPCCGGQDRPVRACFKQATRATPVTFLGFEGWCVPCQIPFKIDPRRRSNDRC